MTDGAGDASISVFLKKIAASQPGSSVENASISGFLNLIQCLGQICNQIFLILDAAAHADSSAGTPASFSCSSFI